MAVLQSDYVSADRLLPLGVTGSTFGGGIVQVSSSRYFTPTTQAITANSISTLPFSASITPRYSSNAFLIYCRITGEFSSAWDILFGVNRNGTTLGNVSNLNRPGGIGVPVMSWASSSSNNASTPETCQFWYGDAPGTSSTLTYTPWIRSRSGQTIRINRTWTDTDNRAYNRMQSQVTIFEISR